MPAGDSSSARPLNLVEDFPVPTYEQWRAVAEKDLRGAEFDRKLLWRVDEKVALPPMLRREDVAALPLPKTYPGQPPFLRGGTPLQHVAPPWQVRQDCLLATPEAANQAIRDGLARGQTAIAIRLDDAARRGMDGSDPTAADLTGHGGCTISSINGLRLALQDIDLEKWPVTFRTGTAALQVLGLLVALTDEQKIPRHWLTGAVECDPVRSLLKRGRVRGSMELQYREMAEIVAFCTKECPGLRGIMANSHVYHNAGASAVQELAFTMGSAIEYLRAMEQRGLSAEQTARSTIFSFSVSTDLLVEIAKLRAARVLWYRIVQAFHPKSAEAGRMFLHARTSARTKTAWDAHSNMIRSSIEAFAAAAGGADSIYVAPFDECVGRPDEFSMRVARNQQLLLREEAHFDRVVDPVGGSYVVEELTEKLSREAWALIQETDRRGGLVKAIEAGWVQQEVGKSREKREKDVAGRRQTLVGINNFAKVDETPLRKAYVPRAEFIAERQRRLHRLKSVRLNSRVRELLAQITEAAATGPVGALMPVVLEAAREGATIGEMTQALTAANGKPSEIATPLPSRRESASYEELRNRVEQAFRLTGKRPVVALLAMGPFAMRRARADFSHGFLGAGGIVTVEPPGIETAQDAAKAAQESGARIVVLCSGDPEYSTLVPEVAAELRMLPKAPELWVAGYPKDTVDALRDAGASGFIHIRADQLKTLQEMLERLL